MDESTEDNDSEDNLDYRPQSRTKLLIYGILAALVLALAVLCIVWVSSSQNAEDNRVESPNVLEVTLAPTAAPPHSKPMVWQNVVGKVFLQEGPAAGEIVGTEDECKDACDSHPVCGSFSRCSDSSKCFFKSATKTGHEPMVANDECSSYFKSSEYFPGNPILLEPNPDPALTFYIYRAQNIEPGGKLYAPANTNVGTIGGVMWYLHNEVIKTCDGEGTFSKKGKLGDRKFGINKIRRMKVTMKPTNAIKAMGSMFGTLQSFDYGESTGPHLYSPEIGPRTGWLSYGEWEHFGYYVGCGYVGDWPHKTEIGGWTSGKSYPNAIWYSFVGACPQLRYYEQTEQCKIEYPGGMCDQPTGQGNCTWTWEEAGDIDIDELVGITPKWSSRAEFCDMCKVEGGPYTRPDYDGFSYAPDPACDFDWWGPNIWTDKVGNAARTEKALDMFLRKYPDMPRELPPPVCDFNREKYETYGGAVYQPGITPAPSPLPL